MLVRFFKIMGLSAGKSLQSCADLNSAKSPKMGINLDKPEAGCNADHSVAGSVRRQEVKTPAKKSQMVKKATPAAKPAKASAKVAAKPVKPVKAAVKKPAAKPAAKSVAKPAVKAKTASKPAAKPVSKPSPKSVPPAKKTSTIKPATKAAAKPATKVAAKPAAKPVSKAQKTQPKAQAKPKSKVVTPVAAKTMAKPAAKSTPKSGAPQPIKALAKSVPSGLAAKSTATVSPTPALVVAVTKPKSSKAGFNSPSNIAPRNVVVSTAAKTSFTMSAPVLSPPPQLVVKKDPKLVNNWKTRAATELTDQEVIAMPDSEYMNDKQLAFFRLKLVQLKKDILSNAGETTEHLREDTSVVPDPADRATIEEEHALELRTRDRERKLLKKIEQSIVRIDANDYGYCDETGEAIGVARLIARPTATLSLEAQQRRELKQKMFGD